MVLLAASAGAKTAVSSAAQDPAPALLGAFMPQADGASDTQLSRPFASAGIEVVAALEQWKSNMAFIIEKGYPARGNWTRLGREDAATALKLAAIAVFTPADRQALGLLRTQFEKEDAWTGGILASWQDMNAQWSIMPGGVESSSAYLTLSACNRFLNSMLVSGRLQNDAACSAPTNQ
jgi:hypothetical protein